MQGLGFCPARSLQKPSSSPSSAHHLLQLRGVMATCLSVSTRAHPSPGRPTSLPAPAPAEAPGCLYNLRPGWPHPPSGTPFRCDSVAGPARDGERALGHIAVIAVQASSSFGSTTGAICSCLQGNGHASSRFSSSGPCASSYVNTLKNVSKTNTIILHFGERLEEGRWSFSTPRAVFVETHSHVVYTYKPQGLKKICLYVLSVDSFSLFVPGLQFPNRWNITFPHWVNSLILLKNANSTVVIDIETLKSKLVTMYSASGVDMVCSIHRLMKIKINKEKVVFIEHKETPSDAYVQIAV